MNRADGRGKTDSIHETVLIFTFHGSSKNGEVAGATKMKPRLLWLWDVPRQLSGLNFISQMSEIVVA
jgi:hypothetical protein